MRTALQHRSDGCDVVVAGGGPVGLMIACELRLGGLRTVLVERRTEIDQTVKAFGLHLPTAEALYRRGMMPALVEHQQREFIRLATFLSREKNATALAASTKMAGHFAGITVYRDAVDYSDPEFGDPGPASDLVPVSQQTLEGLLDKRARELGAEIHRGPAVSGFDEDDHGITVHLDSGPPIRATWLVGADGGRSTIRKLADFDFPGTDPQITGRQAIVELADPDTLAPGWHRSGGGIYVYTPMAGRVLTVELDGPPSDRDAPVTREELEASLRHVAQHDVTITAVKTATRFTDHARQASTYRQGRVLLAGDAAHVHSPFGGQGLNLGIGDAMNLGWKLSATVQGWAPQGLLDTYTSERHPIGAWVLDWTRAQIALMRVDPLVESLRAIVSDLVNTKNGATYVVKKLSGVLHAYDIVGDHPLTGRSAPDIVVTRHKRLGDCLHQARALLVGPPVLSETATAWSERIQFIEHTKSPAMLVRPDGYVAWASDDRDDLSGLELALHTWFGEPATTAS